MDTKIELATCNSCGGYVMATAEAVADTQPLDAESYRAALIAGRSAYDVIAEAGRPRHLRLRTASVSGIACVTVASHSCGAGVTPLGAEPSPAAAVTGRPAKSWAHRCSACRCLIEAGESFTAIDHERYHWAQHDVCPVRASVRVSDAL
ncbi:hypothetical protein [Streptomyces atriruber]|uniref:hypothetical protein n=1 Tax=Streptomyces atriruber TaxID=545121 RepID=UPI0006E22800|nr:hypothetical protein [Streptomyces atriruber]